ncbi:MAG: hypothetical protein JW768_01225 [Chitinispirillaceae bacterium]|nr:hypothetical protein [Chitinispirillaceae bacterium]
MKKNPAMFQKLTGMLLLSAVLTAGGFGAEPDSVSLVRSLFCFHGGGGGGGAGGIAPSIQWLDLSPVENVVENETDLSLYRFDFSDNALMMIGGMGYGGTRCGAKIGGGGWFGYKKFVSNSRNVLQRDSSGFVTINNGDTVKVDSLARLHTMLAYGGLLVEKNISFGDFTFEIGGLFGGGALVLGKEFDTRQNISAFSDFSEYDSAEVVNSWTAAPLYCFDLHGGISYRVARFMVVGADANLFIARSSWGFNLNTDSFLTLNPGIRFRILFGNIG